jgi:hypothetical protein
MVIDTADAALAEEIKGPEVLVTNTLMRSAEDKRRLARGVLAFGTNF